MTPEQYRQIFERLDAVNEADKSIDALTDWYITLNRPTGKLQWQAALKLNGRLGGGVSATLSTPIDVWEKDVYGQITVLLSAQKRTVRLNPVEWRPIRPHSNPFNAPEGHALRTYLDRWHPYELNRDRDISVFLQSAVGVAAPLPDDINSFSDYLHFCARVWKCPDIRKVPPPPWSPSLV